MKRRDFLASIIAAGVASAFLPTATTYTRRWLKDREIYLPRPQFDGAIVSVPAFKEYTMEFVGCHIGLFNVGAQINFGTSQALITEITQSNGRTLLKARSWRGADLSTTKCGGHKIARPEQAIIQTVEVFDTYELRPS
jgi:hypothetical protein